MLYLIKLEISVKTAYDESGNLIYVQEKLHENDDDFVSQGPESGTKDKDARDQQNGVISEIILSDPDPPTNKRDDQFPEGNTLMGTDPVLFNLLH